MRDIITLSLLTTFLISCNHKPKESITYFGGEIINPNSRYVVLYKDDDPVDTAALGNDNRFLMKLYNVESGLYNFKHEPEFQYVFIEEGDSILMRLNTYDFDESLVFTGKGDIKNNFLIEMFLMNEDEEKLIYKYYGLDAEDFVRKTDSLRAMKLEQYQNLIQDYELSEDAQNIARAGIDYIHYANMEVYPYMHKVRNNLDKVEKLPEDFYDYRATLNFEDSRLTHFRPYFHYMVMRMNNLSYVHHMKIRRAKDATVTKKDWEELKDVQLKNSREKDIAIERTLEYHTYKLHLTDSLITDRNLKDNLYWSTAYIYFLSGNRPESDNKIFLEKFDMLSKNNKYIEEIHQLHASIREIQPGKPLPEFSLVNTNGDIVISEDMYNSRKKVFYFWSSEQKNYMGKISERVSKLKRVYPSYEFIGINVNDSPRKWVKYINSFFCFNADKQFRVQDYENLKEKLVISNLNKVIVTEGDGTIIDAFAKFYDKSLEDTLAIHQDKKKKKRKIPDTRISFR